MAGNRDRIQWGVCAWTGSGLDLAVQLWPQLMAHIQQPFDQSAAGDEYPALTSLFDIQEQHESPRSTFDRLALREQVLINRQMRGLSELNSEFQKLIRCGKA